jgi:hypothetical protein
MKSKECNAIPDSPTDECKEVLIELDFPGDISEADITRVVTSFLEGRDLLPDLLALKKHGPLRIRQTDRSHPGYR